MRNQVRAFIAVDLSSSVRSSVGKLVRSLQNEIDGTKWVEPQNLHVTLKFLGDTQLNDLPRLIEAMQRAAATVKAFDLDFIGCGAFPNLADPKTIWIGCEQGAEELTRLAAAVEDELFKLGYPKENRRFSPHLTIGRVKKTSRNNGEFLTDFFEQKAAAPFGSCDVDEIILYSSELTRRGPIYDVLATVTLK